MMDALRFAVTLATLYAAHSVADHWIQTHTQATCKESSWRALAGHVASYTATLAGALALVDWRFDLGYHWAALASGLVVNALSHAWADRRRPLRALAVRLGKAGYWDNGGAYQLDQAWHLGWLFASAFLIAA